MLDTFPSVTHSGLTAPIKGPHTGETHMITECRCPQCNAEYERDEYEDAPEIEWDTPISDDELAERFAWFWEGVPE